MQYGAPSMIVLSTTAAGFVKKSSKKERSRKSSWYQTSYDVSFDAGIRSQPESKLTTAL